MRIMRLTVFVGVLLVTCGWWEHGYSQPNNSGNANAASEHSADTSNEVSLPVRIITTPSDQEKYDAEAKDREDSRNRDESNLTVQRSIAKSSEQVAHYTSLQVWIAGASIFFGILTLGTAVTAVVFARKSATAAQESVEITRHFGEAQTRAYVFAESASLDWSASGVQAVITIANCGTTPAKHFSVHGIVELVEIGSNPKIPDVEIDDHNPIYSTLGTSEKKTIGLVGPNITIRQWSTQPSTYISVRGTITYVTIFDETLVTQFIFSKNYRGRGSQNMSKSSGKLEVFKLIDAS